MLAPVQNDRNSPGFDDGGAAGSDDEAHNVADSRAGAQGTTGRHASQLGSSIAFLSAPSAGTGSMESQPCWVSTRTAPITR